MKKTTLFFIFLSYISIYPQCISQNTDEDLISVSTGQIGQSFTPSCNGLLQTIGVVGLATEVVTVTLYQGEGYNGNVVAVLSNQSITPAINFTDYSFFDFSAFNIVLDVGQVYTFDISNTTSGLVYDNSNIQVYAAGQCYVSQLAQPDSDLLFIVNMDTAPCIHPDLPTLSYIPETICVGNQAQIHISGNLNYATHWAIYDTSCGNSLVGSTSTNTFMVTPDFPSTTYYVRGEGGCVTPAGCSSIAVLTALPDVVTFDPLPEVCIAAGVQNGLGGGSPQGGQYSGTAVVDDGNGLTFSYDPAVATVGTHTITYTYSNAQGCIASVNQNITVQAMPDVSLDESATPTLVANQTGASYQWMNCDTNSAIPGETNPSFTATVNGNYAVVITKNGCSLTSNCINIETLSISRIFAKNNNPIIYPIPVNNEITIQSDFDKAILYNMAGQKVLETHLSKIPVIKLTSGTYFLALEKQEKTITQRIILK